MADTTTKTQVRPVHGPGIPSVQWRHWPLADRVYIAPCCLVSLAATGWLVWYVSGKLHLSLLAVVLVAAAQWRQFTPVTYRLDVDGITQTLFGRSRTIPWPAVKQIECFDHGLLLFPQQKQHARDVYRGIFLAFSEHRMEVLACLETYVPYRLESEDPAENMPDK